MLATIIYTMCYTLYTIHYMPYTILVHCILIYTSTSYRAVTERWLLYHTLYTIYHTIYLYYILLQRHTVIRSKCVKQIKPYTNVYLASFPPEMSYQYLISTKTKKTRLEYPIHLELLSTCLAPPLPRYSITD